VWPVVPTQPVIVNAPLMPVVTTAALIDRCGGRNAGSLQFRSEPEVPWWSVAHR
jgi:hypothetical protein